MNPHTYYTLTFINKGYFYIEKVLLRVDMNNDDLVGKLKYWGESEEFLKKKLDVGNNMKLIKVEEDDIQRVVEN